MNCKIKYMASIQIVINNYIIFLAFDVLISKYTILLYWHSKYLKSEGKCFFQIIIFT